MMVDDVAGREWGWWLLWPLLDVDRVAMADFPLLVEIVTYLTIKVLGMMCIIWRLFL